VDIRRADGPDSVVHLDPYVVEHHDVAVSGQSGAIEILKILDAGERRLTLARRWPPDHPVLVVDLMDFQGETLEPFRCIPSELWGVENNLNLANMDWADFADATGEDRVFRGF
jgi:hypothetical protein